MCFQVRSATWQDTDLVVPPFSLPLPPSGCACRGQVRVESLAWSSFTVCRLPPRCCRIPTYLFFTSGCRVCFMGRTFGSSSHNVTGTNTSRRLVREMPSLLPWRHASGGPRLNWGIGHGLAQKAYLRQTRKQTALIADVSNQSQSSDPANTTRV